ncbi:MAG: nucleoside 2-deoxyribosyltransferase [bacterium]|nr:nucleoside 2-deoxyribosyltransferase [bacterium]
MSGSAGAVSRRKTLYLANPYGFSPPQRAGPLQELVGALEAVGAEPWEPFALGDQEGWAREPGWAYKIGRKDTQLVRDSDGIFAVVNGCPPDEGVMVELGMAIAWGKPTFLFRDDFRRCADSDTYPLNLMLFTGLPEHGWEDYWYTSTDEIADSTKALARWLAGEPL